MSTKNKTKVSATRRAFVRDASLGAAGLGILASFAAGQEPDKSNRPKNNKSGENVSKEGITLERLEKIEKIAQRALDIHEIQNVMSKRQYYHSANMDDQAVDELWAQKTPGVATEQENGDRYVGLEVMRDAHSKHQMLTGLVNRKEAAKMFPGVVEDDPKNNFIGFLAVHCLTTPVLEVAEDGQTAKGIWVAPGFLTTMGGSYWHYDRYGVDFVKEDGKWKIWHVRVFQDFLAPYEKSWYEVGKDPALLRRTLEDRLASILPADELAKFAVPKPNAPALAPPYSRYNPLKVSQLAPRIPVPYKTFSETFSF